MRRVTTLFALLLAAIVGCGEAAVIEGEAGDNPFLDDGVKPGKADTHYLNPDGIEVEVDIEANIVAPRWRLDVAPATLAQFAMTHLRNRGVLYLESLAETASAKDRIEWLVDGEWVQDAPDSDEETLRFRMRGVNAVLLHEHVALAVEGQVITVPVPVRPYDVMAEAGDRCAEQDGHMALSQTIYWYLWSPNRPGCKVDVQDMRLTVSKVLPGEDSYPEYDRLVEDGKVTTVVVFGQIGDTLDESDSGFRNLKRMARNLEYAGYREVEAPLGRRFAKEVEGIVLEVDLYSPYEFSGLSDHANFPNFEKAIAEHEIVAYDGHSMLGASDFWAKPAYPDFYQVFLYGGCLGYEYYVHPIVEGKGGWGNVDIVSSVIEVTADANDYTGPFLAKLERAITGGYDVSWKDMLGAIRSRVGDSTFGVSGARENCFDPKGSRCPVE